jgi:flavin reductase (DIM6/NTAB) family NADH-FMN oxidoreductase RutF
MIYTKKDISNLDRVERLKLINSSTGVKPANLIGSINKEGQTNLSIFSSVVHLGSDPALLGMISRPRTKDVGHTYDNILERDVYTINHLHPGIIKNAHYTSAKFPKDVSEFDRCGLTEEYLGGIEAPFVKESQFKIGLRFKEAIDIKINRTVLIIGEIEYLQIPNDSLVNGDINLQTSQGVGISGLNSYYSLSKIAHFPYVRLEDFPIF